MHELSVVQSIVKTTCDFLDEKNIDSAKFLTLVIGQHTGVIPSYVKMYYREVCEGTKLEGTELNIEETKTEYFCKDCGHVFSPENDDHHHLETPHCPECHSEDLECISGDELMIKEVGYE